MADRQGFSDVMSVVRAVFCGLVVGNGGRGNRRNGEGTLRASSTRISSSSRSLTDLVPRIFPSIVDRRPPSIRLRCFSAPLIRASPFRVSRRVSLLHVKLETRAIKAYLARRNPPPIFPLHRFFVFDPTFFPPFETRFNRQIGSFREIDAYA